MQLIVDENMLSKLRKKLIGLLIVSITFSGYNSVAQDYLKEGMLEEQYNSMLEKSETYKQYKVIPRGDLRKFRSNFKDTLSLTKSDYLNSQNTIESQQLEIDQLKTELGTTQNVLQKTNDEKSSIQFLGISMSKLKYKGLMWTLLGLSLAALLYFLYRFRNSSLATQGIQKQLSETQLAFDAYKKRALDKEQKISRMLQDELNKVNKSK